MIRTLGDNLFASRKNERDEYSMTLGEPFRFYECMSLLQTTGLKTATLPEFIGAIRVVSPGAIFHHTHRSYLKGVQHVPEYTNDFSLWVANYLEERALAEKLASIDFYSMGSIEDIRKAIIDILEDYEENFPPPRPARPSDQFFFNEAITLVIPTELIARDLDDLKTAIRQVGASSIYYHFFEARIRVRGPSDDFSFWAEQSLGLKNLCQNIRQLDPYLYSLEGLRGKLIEIIALEQAHG